MDYYYYTGIGSTQPHIYTVDSLRELASNNNHLFSEIMDLNMSDIDFIKDMGAILITKSFYIDNILILK
jgi:hypothetical protein